jgi:hypothetical protein
MDELEAAYKALVEVLPSTDAKSWGVDAQHNDVYVSVPSGLAGDPLDAIDNAVRGATSLPVVREVDARTSSEAPQPDTCSNQQACDPPIHSGQYIQSSLSRCSSGGLGLAGSTWYVFSAGHCFTSGNTSTTGSG